MKPTAEQIFDEMISIATIKPEGVYDANSDVFKRAIAETRAGRIAVIEKYLNRPDEHLFNLIRRCREELQANRPVIADMWLNAIEEYLK